MILPSASYYPEGEQHSPGKYQENGHDTFSDFVTLVCQEAQNTQPQVSGESADGPARAPAWPPLVATVRSGPVWSGPVRSGPD